MASDSPAVPVIDEILSGDVMGLPDVARWLPAHRGEGRMNPSTVWRWVTAGCRIPSGRVVKLEAARVGGRWLTSQAALTRFMTTLTPTTDATKPQPPCSAPQRRKAVEAANRRLAEMGA